METANPQPQEAPVPELLPEGLPNRGSRSKFDFTDWADGRAWKFVKGSDYESSTETFRANVKRWAKLKGFQVELRPYPTVDRTGHEVPLIKADAGALGVRFIRTDHGQGTGEADTLQAAATSRPG
jgi:hypothetical protein